MDNANLGKQEEESADHLLVSLPKQLFFASDISVWCNMGELGTIILFLQRKRGRKLTRKLLHFYFGLSEREQQEVS